MVANKRRGQKAAKDRRDCHQTEQLLEHANELGVDLMEDDSGAIIIMDEKRFR